MMAKHNVLGQKGEDAAVAYLQQKGYKILKRNWRYERYEIDIIAQNEEFIIFIEVKTRTSAQWGSPEDAVSKGKMKRIIEAADFYLNEYLIDQPARFDVIALTLQNATFDIEHIEDAFLASLN